MQSEVASASVQVASASLSTVSFRTSPRSFGQCYLYRLCDPSLEQRPSGIGAMPKWYHDPRCHRSLACYTRLTCQHRLLAIHLCFMRFLRPDWDWGFKPRRCDVYKAARVSNLGFGSHAFCSSKSAHAAASEALVPVMRRMHKSCVDESPSCESSPTALAASWATVQA